MIETRIIEVRQLLRKHGYVPIVQKVGDGALIKTPCPIDTPPLVGACSIRRESPSGVYINSSGSAAERFVALPEYAIRFYLTMTAVAYCERVPISDRLIHYFDEEGRERKGIEDLIEPPQSDGDRSLESFLAALFTEAREGGFPREYEEVARTHGVHEGYQIVKQVARGMIE